VTHLKQELFTVKARLLKAEEVIQCNKTILPMIHKESKKREHLAMIGAVIVAILGIIMWKLITSACTLRGYL
jgi:hypothetical protein